MGCSKHSKKFLILQLYFLLVYYIIQVWEKFIYLFD